MFRNLSQRAGRNIFTTAKRNGGSALSGDATSPHYADFGHGANQMLPFHELAKNPIPYKWTPRAAAPEMMPGHHPSLHQHQQFTQATGHAFGMYAGPSAAQEHAKRVAVMDRVKGTLGYLSIFSCLAAYEYWMWDGLQFLQHEVWDELAVTNFKMNVHGLQWEKSWREIQRDTPVSELYQIMKNRPFFTNNPYRFSDKDMEIANKNISYRAIEPVLAAVDADLYRKQTNYIIFYSQLADKLAEVSSAKDLESELSQWLFEQTMFTAADLNEILAFAPEWNADFAFHQKAVFDPTNNQIVFFSGPHRACVEEEQKPVVESIKEQAGDKATAFSAAQPLLVQLIKGGPTQFLKEAVMSCGDVDEFKAREAVLGFMTLDVNKEQQAKLQKVAQQVLSSSDNSLATFQANAAGLGLPVPASFSTSAINFAIAAKNNAV